MAQPKKIHGLLFDKDGTLIDFHKTWTEVSFSLARRAARGDEARARFLLEKGGYDFDNRCFKGDSIIAAGSSRDIVKLWHPEFDETQIEQEIAFIRDFCLAEAGHSLSEVAGATQTLKVLKRLGYYLGIATNDSKAGAAQAVDKLGWHGIFDVIIGYDSVENAKPAGDQIVYFANHCGLAVHNIAMIGDNNHDISAARAGGAGLAIGVLSGTGTGDQLQQTSDVLLDDINALPDWLAKNTISQDKAAR